MSNADPPLLWGWLVPALGRVPTYLAKAVLFKGVAGPVLRSFGATPVEAGGSDMAAYRVAKAALDAGGVVDVMPEGTRSLDGRLLTAMPGRIAARDADGRDRAAGRHLRHRRAARSRPERAAHRDARHAARSGVRSRSRSEGTTGGPRSRPRTRRSCAGSRRSSTRAIAATGSPGRTADVDRSSARVAGASGVAMSHP